MSIKYHDLNVGVTLGGGGGGGGNVDPQYEIAGFHGAIAGDSSASLSCAVSGSTGAKCLLVIMHRSEITSISNGMTLVHKTGDGWQWISVYEKVMQADSETYVITLASSARVCAASVLTSAETSVTYSGKIDAVSASNLALTIPPQNRVTLIAFSDGYNGNKRLPSGRYVYCLPAMTSASAWRLCVAVVNNVKSFTLSNSSSPTADIYNNYHAYLFTLERQS